MTEIQESIPFIKREEKSFYEAFYKHLKSYAWYFLTHPVGLMLLAFIIFKRKLIYKLITESSEREHAFTITVEALKSNIHLVKKMADENFKAMNH